MRIGDLDKRIVLQYTTRTPDGMGGFTVAWVDAATVWAAIWPVSAVETIQASQATMTITHRIRIRYRAVLKAGWRISYAGRYFNVVSIIDFSTSHRWIDIFAKEATS
jgi:SPP1 family predicted phage head-tail adaptor